MARVQVGRVHPLRRQGSKVARLRVLRLWNLPIRPTLQPRQRRPPTRGPTNRSEVGWGVALKRRRRPKPWLRTPKMPRQERQPMWRGASALFAWMISPQTPSVARMVTECVLLVSPGTSRTVSSTGSRRPLSVGNQTAAADFPSAPYRTALTTVRLKCWLGGKQSRQSVMPWSVKEKCLSRAHSAGHLHSCRSMRRSCSAPMQSAASECVVTARNRPTRASAALTWRRTWRRGAGARSRRLSPKPSYASVPAVE
mmetsp:Transcript_3998/g.12785  ORF Transcript_3998/g.12785 Transcript_3998/m.12785 type:complete len:254 (-) Transcript_3998:162-923(-)